MKRFSFFIMLTLCSLASFAQSNDFNYYYNDIGKTIKSEINAQVNAQMAKYRQEQAKQAQAQTRQSQTQTQAAQQQAIENYTNKMSVEGHQRMEYYNNPDNYIDRSITNRSSSFIYSNQNPNSSSYNPQSQRRDLRTEPVHSENLKSRSLQMLREANRNVFSNENREASIDHDAIVPLFDAPSLSEYRLGDADANNVQFYFSNSEPLMKDYLGNPKELESLLKKQFEQVSGYNMDEIRNKQPENRTLEEKQALADYEAYRIREMEQMNIEIERTIDNTKEKREIDAAILALDVYGDDGEGYINNTNYKRMDIEAIVTVNDASDYNPIADIAMAISVCNNTEKGIDGTGVHVELYYNAITDSYVIACAGSGPDDIKDWVYNNAANALGGDVPQYILAKTIGDAINRIPQAAREKLDIEVVGHSLGGGMASVIGLTSGIETKTYNAARVPNDFLKENGLDGKVNSGDVQNIIAFHTSTDALTKLQEKVATPAIGISVNIGDPANLKEKSIAVGAGAVAGYVVAGGKGVKQGAEIGEMLGGHSMPPIVRGICNSNIEKKQNEWNYLRNAQYQLQKELRNAEIRHNY